MGLIKEMEEYLPIPVYPTRELCKLLQKQGIDIDINRELKITKVFESGDLGGIVCTVIEENTKVFIVSLTHLRIKSSPHLSDKILAYQRDRMKKLSEPENT